VSAREVRLRPVAEEDIPAFFEHQTDPEANRMAAFTVPDPTDREAFARRWRRILSDPGITTRTIVADGRVVGHVASFERDGSLEVTYWIDREHWGRGIATAALAEFLRIVETRPIHARAAKDNLASIRVLEKCGFVVTGEERAFAEARGEEVEELLMTAAKSGLPSARRMSS